MIRRFMVTAAYFGIVACATSMPEPPEPGTNVGNSVTGNNSTAAENEVEVVDVPEVPISTNIPPGAEVTCRNQTEIGSRRVKRICRSRSEIDETQTAAQDTLHELQRTQEIQDSPIRH